MLPKAIPFQLTQRRVMMDMKKMLTRKRGAWGQKRRILLISQKEHYFFKKTNQPDKPTLLKWGKKKAKLLIKVTHVHNKRGKPQSFAIPWTWHSTTRLGWYTEHTSERLNQQFFMIQINLIFCTSSPLFPVAFPSCETTTLLMHTSWKQR